MEQKGTGKYEFISEKVKKKPLNKKKLIQKVVMTVILALVFGVVASLTLTFLQPKMSEWAKERTDSDIVIETGEDKISVSGKKEKEEQEKNQEKEKNKQNENRDTISVADIQRLKYQLFGVAGSVDNAIVKIQTGEEVPWTEELRSADACGIIIAKENNEIIILAEQWVIQGQKNIGILFHNESPATALVKGYNESLGIAVLSVDAGKISVADKKSIEVAELGSSKGISRGMYVIAVGTPLGGAYSGTVGNVIGVNHTLSYADCVFPVLTTDISIKSYGRGFLLDASGKIVGIITHDGDEKGEENTLQAIPISELKPYIEGLANGEEAAYLGLDISTVTNSIARTFQLPFGVYVKEARMNSPAMQAGIKKGDVVVRMGGADIENAYAYQLCLSEAVPGEQLNVTVMRYGQKEYKELKCTVTVGKVSDYH